MSRGKRVPEVVRAYINELAYNHPNWQNSELREDVIHHFKGTNLYIPGPDSFRKIAKEARRPSEEDVPWCIGVLPALVPSEAMEDVFSVWRWSKVRGCGFSAREAKWVVRLRLVLPRRYRHAEFFHLWATRYAAREKASEGRGSFDTTDLDELLAFEGDVYLAMVDTGTVRPSSLDASSYYDDLVFRVLFELEVPLMPSWFQLDEAIGRKAAKKLMKSIPAQNLSEVVGVSSIWLKAMSTASGWSRLSVQRRKDVVHEVFRQVMDFFDKKPELARSLDEDHFQPTEALLTEIGYHKLRVEDY